ncbi:MAG: 30S ribosomal protein S17 [Actinomycetota bacterium]|nr:30S ribosomal protein S17 [Actinomycetota bacterium]
MSDLDRTSRKVRTGIVVSDKRENTVTVAIELQYPHPKYGKIVKKTRKLHVHDEKFDSKIGDTVEIMETKPISKTKRWRVTEVIERAK